MVTLSAPFVTWIIMSSMLREIHENKLHIHSFCIDILFFFLASSTTALRKQQFYITEKKIYATVHLQLWFVLLSIWHTGKNKKPWAVIILDIIKLKSIKYSRYTTPFFNYILRYATWRLNSEIRLKSMFNLSKMGKAFIIKVRLA